MSGETPFKFIFKCVPISPSQFSQGYEDKLTECQHKSYDDCSAGEAAGVVCEGDGMCAMISYIYQVVLLYFCFIDGVPVYHLGLGGTGAELTSDGGLLFSKNIAQYIDRAQLNAGEFCLVQVLNVF